MPSLVSTLPPLTRTEDLDELPRRIMRSWVVWKSALDANYAAEEFDGTAPSGSGLILVSLFERDRWTASELALQSKLTPIAVLHLIQRMKAIPLVKHKQCPDKSRATRGSETGTGHSTQPRSSHAMEP